MNEEQQLKLQAFLDGELPEEDAREVAAWVARDADATALLGELRNTRKALANFEPGLKLPESREFFWSKIEREIRSLEPAPAPAKSTRLGVFLRRIFVPLGAVAALALAAMIAHRQSGPPVLVEGGLEAELLVADSGTVTYRDYEKGVTYVWLPYPAE